MRVHNGGDVGPRLEDRRMDEALEIGLALIVDRFAFLVELDQVVALDQFRRARARHEEALRIVRVAHADMAIGIDDVLVRQNTVGHHEVAQKVVKLAHVGILTSERDRRFMSLSVIGVGCFGRWSCSMWIPVRNEIRRPRALSVLPRVRENERCSTTPSCHSIVQGILAE